MGGDYRRETEERRSPLSYIKKLNKRMESFCSTSNLYKWELAACPQTTSP